VDANRLDDAAPMRDALLVIDVIDDFRHPDGDRLLASFRERAAAMRAVLDDARSQGIPVVYANDNHGAWDGDAQGQIRRAIEARPGGDVIAGLAPRAGEQFVVKPRYSAFDLTPLELILAEAGVERLVLIGASLEMCVAQTAIDARERGWKVTVIPAACAAVDDEMAEIAVRYLEQVAGVRTHLDASLPAAASRAAPSAGARS
jgi:nicotinamidase-related amidase